MRLRHPWFRNRLRYLRACVSGEGRKVRLLGRECVEREALGRYDGPLTSHTLVEDWLIEGRSAVGLES